MYCEKCGTELKEGSAFCSKCGTRQRMPQGTAPASRAGQMPQTQTETGQQMRTEGKRQTQAENDWQTQAGSGMQTPQKAVSPVKKSGLSGGVAAAIAVAVVAVVIVIALVMIFFIPGKQEFEMPVEQHEDAAWESSRATDVAEQSPEKQPEEVSEAPLHIIEDVPSVDLGAANHTPGTKQAGMEWDNSLFYWLEDADTLSPEDGNIARCRLTKTLLRNARTGELIQYEIYSDPDSGAVYKIVSVEGADGGLTLTDWYYLSGQPNFVFRRNDTVYTPTYATIDKVGERYYFNNDVMVKWRMIRVPKEVGEYTLAPSDTWYSQGDYYAESDELRQVYDETEMRMLNEAHNTYDAVLSGENIGRVQGYVRDTTGSGIAGRRIKIYRSEDNVLLYETFTDDSGFFSAFVYLDDTDCYLKTEADGQYKEMVIQGIRLVPVSLTYACDMTLHKEGGDEYPVTLRVYPAADIRDDGEGNVAGELLQTAGAVIREGAGNYTGDILRTVETQNGELTMNLPSGTYTVQVQADGYPDTYTEIEVWEEATVRDIYVMPGLAEGQTGILLTWEGEADLDLTLFTPWQAAEGDMAHIGGSVSGDAHGNLLVADNKRRCEVMYVNTAEVGSYKLYVNNYTDSLAGNYASDLLSGLRVRIFLYNSDGFVAEYTIPLGQKGVVWEVAEINGKNVTPAQRVYSEITGKKWWTEDKEKAVVRTKLTVQEDEGGSCLYEEYDEKGKIVFSEYYQGTTERSGEPEWAYTYVYEYDEYGNVKSEIRYAEDGTPSDKIEYEYTYVNGRISVCEELYYLSEWWSEVSSGTYTEYDEEGRIVFAQGGGMTGSWSFYSETEEYIDRKISEELGVKAGWGYLYIYDESGNLLREEDIDEYGNRTVTQRYTYDEAGRVIKFEDFLGDISITEYIYDPDGRLESTYERKGEGVLFSQSICYYDDHGYLVREEYADQETMYHVIDYTYDERGRCIREETSFFYSREEAYASEWRERIWNAPGMFDMIAQGIADGKMIWLSTKSVEYTYY
ncbi:zinc-ribbon domain-containing protein [Acetatifactor muris]|uniref:zinc-ribbon domain-containing protein n=1 Tax=Acetatifactor muris TaxID=879566 RepID=UPI0023F447D3|nr:zinc-ribbon domain-containing protein [Acetatifactor muris]